MGKTRIPRPVLLFVGMLCPDPPLMNELAQVLEGSFGPVLYQSRDLPWAHTDYYAEELGENLLRRFVFFRDLVAPDRIAEIKIRTNEMETRYAGKTQGEIQRRINLDPGYLDASKVVLATTKDYSHRIYLSQGIYAEVTLMFVRGCFRAGDHTYPDYRDPETIETFNRMRSELLRARQGGQPKE